MNAKKACDEMYMKKCAIEDAVLAKIRDPENMNPEN